MKFTHLLSAIILTLSLSVSGMTVAQAVDPLDSTGLDGDHFSLEGALELFKNSKSPEDFEKKLNTESSNINNLDLNEDGEVDYIRVFDKQDGDVHAIILQVAVSAHESQDIAVIEIEKTGKESAILQIVGDEALYGDQVIVEPFDVEVTGEGKGGPSVDFEMTRVVVNVYFWTPIRFIYHSTYRGYESPWYWGFWPTKWWRPWRPMTWTNYHQHHVLHHRHYHVVSTHRVVRAHKLYAPYRKTSKVVRTRTTTKIVSGDVRTKAVRAHTTTTVRIEGGKRHGVGNKSRSAKRVKTNKVAVSKKTTITKSAKRTKKGTVKGKKSTTSKKVKRKKGND